MSLKSELLDQNLRWGELFESLEKLYSSLFERLYVQMKSSNGRASQKGSRATKMAKNVMSNDIMRKCVRCDWDKSDTNHRIFCGPKHLMIIAGYLVRENKERMVKLTNFL